MKEEKKSNCCNECFVIVRSVIGGAGTTYCGDPQCSCHTPAGEAIKENLRQMNNQPIFNPTNMTHQQLKEWEEMRKSFFLKIADFTDDNHHDVEPYSMQKIADWWLSELLALLQRKSEEIEGLRIARDENTVATFPTFHKGYVKALTDAQAILLKG